MRDLFLDSLSGRWSFVFCSLEAARGAMLRWVSVGVSLLWCAAGAPSQPQPEAEAEEGVTLAQGPRLFYSIASYDRRQHVHLKRLVAEAASACEGGLRVTLRVYSCDGTAGSAAFSEAELAELEKVAFCTRRGGLALVHEVRPGALRRALTMEHRDAFREELASPARGASPEDVFAYGEDDVLLSVRSVMALASEAGEWSTTVEN